MAPIMETDRHHQDWIIRVTPVKRPTCTGMDLMNRLSGLFIHPFDPCDEDSSPSSGSDTPLHQFVCVYHPESSGPGNEFGDVYKRADANTPGDVIVMSGESRETFDKPSFDKTSALCYEAMVASTFKMDCKDLGCCQPGIAVVLCSPRIVFKGPVTTEFV